MLAMRRNTSVSLGFAGHHRLVCGRVLITLDRVVEQAAQHIGRLRIDLGQHQLAEPGDEMRSTGIGSLPTDSGSQ